jgi:hypothetical protein
MKKLSISAMALLSLMTWNASSDAQAKDEIVVVVNKANGAFTLSRDELRPMFQTTRSHWPDGVRVEPLNLADENPTRQGFDAVVLGLDPDRVARYWVDRKIRGGERPPRKVAAPSSVIRAVAGDKGGVGYLPAGDVNDSVRVVARIRNGRVMSP